MCRQGTGTPVNRSPVNAHTRNRLCISRSRAGKQLVLVFPQVLQCIIYFSNNLQDGLGGCAERRAQCARDALMQHRTEKLKHTQPKHTHLGPASEGRGSVKHLQINFELHKLCTTDPWRALLHKGKDPPQRGPKVAARGDSHSFEFYEYFGVCFVIQPQTRINRTCQPVTSFK